MSAGVRSVLKIAVIVPPMSNLNTAYAALPRLSGWLRQLGHEVTPIDLSIELFLRVFSRAGIERVFDAIDRQQLTSELAPLYVDRDRYADTIDDAIRLLQGRDASLALRLVDRLPRGPGYRRHDPETYDELFGTYGHGDRARYLASRMIQDLGYLIQHTVAPLFGMTTYGDRLASSASSFDPLAAEIARPPNVVEAMLEEAAEVLIPRDVDLVGFTCPFPGNVLGAFRLGAWAARHRPRAARALGGGYPSTELRSLTEARVFDHVDYVVLDDGEVPLQQICARLTTDPTAPLVRTFAREATTVIWHAGADARAPRFRELPAPDYGGIDLRQYIQPISTLNPVFRTADEGPWLKLTAAHGCYWKKCTFCDIHLPYIQDFDPLPAAAIADQMDAMAAQTGLASFHFTDEAIPPPLLTNLALELRRRQRGYQFYGNVRFDPGFTPDRSRLLAAAGLVAVTGGIEVASDRLLALIAKGITVEQVIRVLHGMTRAGVRTHAYLIYGFPGETPQDTINSLELLRQMTRARILQSGYFHHFSATAHAPVGRTPDRFGIRVAERRFQGFARYNLDYQRVAVPPDHEWILAALTAALRQYARGKDLERDVRDWFTSARLPAPTVAPDFVTDVLAAAEPAGEQTRLCWLGGRPFWANGWLTVASDRGEQLRFQVPRTIADQLSWCRAQAWRSAVGPRTADFDDPTWFEPFRPHGMVLV